MDKGRGQAGAVIAAVAVAGVVVAAAWSLWPRPAAVAGPRARQYLDMSACLLTGSAGIDQGTPGALAWRAMQSASLASHVMVSYLPASGPGSVRALLSTFAERRCGVVVVTGASQVQVASAAKADPGQRFILVTGTASAASAAMPANALIVPAVRAPGLIDREVTALAGAA
jgi:hypothetical protein